MSNESFKFKLTYDDIEENFELKDGESKGFTLPVNTTYLVEEQDYSKEGYELVMTYNTGTTSSSDVIEVEVRNIYHKELERLIIEGEKKWNVPESKKDKIPKSIDVELWIKDAYLVESKKIVPDEDGLWNFEFDVPKYDAFGEEIKYDVIEIVPKYFDVSYEGNDIVNTYLEPITYAPKVHKVVVGVNKPKVDHNFKFKMEPLEGAPIHKLQKIEILGSGEALFVDIEFTRPGTYKYRITEFVD